MHFNKISSIAIKVLLYSLAVFFCQEIGFRYFFPLPEIKNFDRINYMQLAADRNNVQYLRDQSWYWQSSPDTAVVFEHVMNRYGFRDKEWRVEKQSGVQRVIFVGDSFVEGVMAKQDETIPAGFKNAAGNAPVEVFNAGILGVGLSSYLQLTADILPLYKPDVLFLCIYANDLGENEPKIPEFYFEPKYFHDAKPRLLELFQQITSNGPVLFRWHKESKPFLPASPGANNPWTNDAAELQPHVSQRLAAEMKNGTFNPFRTNSLAKEEHYLKQLPRLGETIPFLRFVCDKFKVEPVVVYIPSRNQVTRHYYPFEQELCRIACPDSFDLTTGEYQVHQRVLAEQCKASQIQFIDLTDVVRESELSGEHLYWNYDEHMKGKGYLLLGKTIWEQWQENSL